MGAREHALSVLDWWRLAGVDVAITEEPRAWLAPPKTPAEAPDVAPPLTPAGPAELPADLAAFRHWLATDPSLGQGPRLAPVGEPASGLMLLGDVPEADDIAAGHLFAGSLGLLFDRMLAAIGRDRSSIYLATLSSARPPAGRLRMTDALADAARHHAALAGPRFLLLLGDAASRAILGTGVIEARGRLHQINHRGATMTAIATFHPRELLRTSGRKADAWRDLRLLLGDMGQ